MIKAPRAFLILLGISFPFSAMAADLYPPLAGGVYEDAELHRLPHTSGYVQGSYSGIVNGEGDGDNWAVRGSINFNPEPGLNIQADIGNAWLSVEGIDGELFSGALHGYYRGHTFAVGGFFEGARTEAALLKYLGDSTITDYLGGIEAAYFSPNDTLYGRAGFGQASWGGASADHALGTLGVRHYFTDGVRFDVEGTLHRLSYGPYDLDLRSIAVTGNYRPAAMPVTLFAGYRFSEAELSAAGFSSLTEDAGAAFGGVRLSFGSSSLKDEERSGSLWTASSLSP